MVNTKFNNIYTYDSLIYMEDTNFCTIILNKFVGLIFLNFLYALVIFDNIIFMNSKYKTNIGMPKYTNMNI